MLLFFCACVYVCALHNAGVKVSGLIFYLSGLITSAFTAALLRSAEDTASLLNLYWERKKKLHVYNLYRGATDATAQTLPVFKVYYSILPQCRNQQQKQILSIHLLMYRSDKAAVYLNGKTCHKAFKWN